MSDGFQLAVDDLWLMGNEDAAEWSFNLLADVASFGETVTVAETITSLMRDGDLTRTTRYGNRTAVFLLEIEGTVHTDLSDAEALLESYLDRPAALTWTVPDGPATVFEVVRSWSDFLFDDFAEIPGQGRKIRRTFRLTFECEPHGRSVDPVTVTWTGGRAQVSLAAATESGGRVTVTPAVPLRDYLWVTATGSAATVGLTVDGVAIPDSLRRDSYTGDGTGTHFLTYDVSAWRGGTPVLSFQGTKASTQCWTIDYPTPLYEASSSPPRPAHGIGVIEAVGTARAPVHISAPGAAFLYTGPDPAVDIRAGAGEAVFQVVPVTVEGTTVTVGAAATYFPPGGPYARVVGATLPRPTELHPNGIYAEYGGTSYPAVRDAAISYFPNLEGVAISPRPTLPQGYHEGATVHEPHSVHPGGRGLSGFAAFDASGWPVTATITYYPRWKHNAGQ